MTAARSFPVPGFQNREQAFAAGYEDGYQAGSQCPTWDTIDEESVGPKHDRRNPPDEHTLFWGWGFRRGFLDGAYPEALEVSTYPDVTALRHPCICSEGTYRWHGRTLFVCAIDGEVQAPIEVRSGPPITPDDEERLTKFFNEEAERGRD